MTMPLPIVPEQYPGGWQRMLYAEPHTPPYRVTDTSGMPTFASPLTRPTSAASKALKSAADHSLNGWRA